MTLADEQAALVAALVAAGPAPPGFDPVRLAAAREALLRKRAGDAAAAWPALAAALGPQWTATFTGWARGRPPGGALRDGRDLARELAATGRLPAPAAAGLRARERWVWPPGWRGYLPSIGHGGRPREAAVQVGGIGAVIVIIWLLIGVLAAGQRGYFSGAQDNCAKAGTTAVTIVAGPLNYIGVNPKVHCQVPQPSQ